MKRSDSSSRTTWIWRRKFTWQHHSSHLRHGRTGACKRCGKTTCRCDERGRVRGDVEEARRRDKTTTTSRSEKELYILLCKLYLQNSSFYCVRQVSFGSTCASLSREDSVSLSWRRRRRDLQRFSCDRSRRTEWRTQTVDSKWAISCFKCAIQLNLKPSSCSMF